MVTQSLFASSLFFNILFIYFLFLFLLYFTLQYCIGFKKEGRGQVAIGEIGAWKNNCFVPIGVVASEEVKKGPRTL